MGAHQQITKKLVIKDDYVKKDGTAAIYIYVSVNGDFERIPLKLSWPPKFFDKDAGKLIARKKDDPDLTDYNLMIEAEIGKLNEIIKTYRLGERPLTLTILLSEYYSYTSRLDFLSWWDGDLKERKKRRKIEDNTAKGHRSALNKLREFWRYETKTQTEKLPVLPFTGLTPKLLENFRAWLKHEHDDAPSTVEKEMTRVRTYVKRALVAKYSFEDPFKVVKIKHPETYPDVLEQEQVIDLLQLYDKPDINDTWRTILRHFLFSCFTGLRISDAKAVNHENIQDEWLVLMPKKTLRLRKVVRIPLHPAAKPFISTTIGQLFDTYSEQYTNRTLGKISESLGLGWKMTTHTARHTFGTVFIELGGDVVTLKDYMGHADIKTTMKYVHLSERRKAEKIRVFDKLLNKRMPPKKLNDDESQPKSNS
ncbi:tyrosine-type recombinase/integrase [Spirosoma litoris]